VRCGHVGFLPLRLEERVRVVQVHSRVPGAGAGTRPLAGRQDPDLCCGGFHGKIGNRRPCAELDRCQPSPHQILNTGYSNDAPHQILMQGRAVRGGRQGRRVPVGPTTDTMPLFRPAGLRCRRVRPASAAVRDGCPRSLPNGPTGSVLCHRCSRRIASSGWHGATQTNVYYYIYTGQRAAARRSPSPPRSTTSVS
jgi:hypothetical protein